MPITATLKVKQKENKLFTGNKFMKDLLNYKAGMRGDRNWPQVLFWLSWRWGKNVGCYYI